MLDLIIRKIKLFYSSCSEFDFLFDKIANSDLYCGLVKNKISFQKNKDKKGLFNLAIETSSICNAACLMCPHQSMVRSKKIMDDQIFDKVIKRLKKEDIPINKIFLSGMGEPLADGKIIERIKALKKMGYLVKLYTNASLLTKAVSEKLVRLGLNEANISFNAASKKQYLKVMGLNFSQVVKNIENLTRAKKRIGSDLPKIRISLIAIKDNERDIDRFVKKWSGLVDSVTVSKPHEWGGKVKIVSDHEFKKQGITYPCRSLWHTVVIDSSGNFVICCRDYESKLKLGNIMTNSFGDIFKSPILKRFRQLHLEFKKEKLPQICQGCNFPYQNGVEWFMPRSLD
ncbi:MAG: radical SAM/SPASM domain-containing protein [Candidatus Shapirobacteria bacterium]